MKKKSNGTGTQFSSPAYRRIGQDLRTKITQGVWGSGAILPSRKDLADEYGVSVPTVERAVSDLLRDGTLRADAGRGTFVASRGNFLDSRPHPSSIAQRIPSNSSLSFEGGHALPAGGTAAIGSMGILSYLELIDNGTRSAERWKDTIINAIERSVTGSGGTTTFSNLRQPDGTRVSLEAGIQSLRAAGAQAIIVVLESDLEAIANVASSHTLYSMPIVFITSHGLVAPVLNVYYDNRQAGYQAALHLLQRGCRDILFFSAYVDDWVLERAAGVRDAIELSGRPDRSLTLSIAEEPITQVLTHHDHTSSAYELAGPLLASQSVADGIVAANDRAAYGFMRAASEIGLTMGYDYALIGFDDDQESRYLGLTTLRPPLAALGEEACKLVYRTLQGERAGLRVCLHSHLVARTSSKLMATKTTAE